MGNLASKWKTHSQIRDDRYWSGKYLVLFSHWKREMWPGSGKYSVKEGMIEIDQERLGIIHSLELGNVTWKSKTHSQRRNDRD